MVTEAQRARRGHSGHKVLVVVEDVNAQRIAELVLAEEGITVLKATDSAGGFRAWADQHPDLVIADQSVIGKDARSFIDRIRSAESAPHRDGSPATHVPILLLESEGTTDSKIRALRSGADDVLVRPFHPAELAAVSRSLLARFASVRTPQAMGGRGRLVAFYGAKGGVGTTTIAINVAIALHRQLKRRTVLVDGNMQFGDHRIVLDFGLDKKSIADMLDAPSVDAELVRLVLAEHDSGIDVLLSPPSPETAEQITQEFMGHVLDELQGMYDDVIVDVDQRLDDLNLRILDQADSVFIVTTSDIMSLKNVGQILDTMDHLGYGEGKVHLVLNRSDAFTGVTARAAETALRRSIDYQLPNHYAGAIAALNNGAPIMLSHANTTLGKAFSAFAKMIDALPTRAEAAAQSRAEAVRTT